MKILAIETSCDETAIAILEGAGDEKSASFTVRGDALLSQTAIHAQYGGVFPQLAKREHAKNLVPLLQTALEEAELLHEDTQEIPQKIHDTVAKLLEREPELDAQLLDFIGGCETPNIDAIAVTTGPGLEPALWVGINFAKALALAWDKPLVAVNHMEGHILSALATRDGNTIHVENMALPILALLISGGHTELVLMRDWLRYELIGQTRDDAVGEAFDKVARMLGLPYPGGPEISKLAEEARLSAEPHSYNLPRPMIDSATCDFSFAGLKTAVLYLLRDQKIPDHEKKLLAREFEDSVTEVLWKKTARALEDTGAQTLVVGGGVSANTHIRRTFEEKTRAYANVTLRIPAASLTTDNAVMIALAGYYRARKQEYAHASSLRANGTLSLASDS